MYVEAHLLTNISWLLKSIGRCPKVFLLSGFHSSILVDDKTFYEHSYLYCSMPFINLSVLSFPKHLCFIKNPFKKSI